MDLLVARLEPGEQVLARGRAFEPSDILRFDLSTVISGPGCAVAVTERRVLWVSGDDERWVRSLRFDLVRSYAELTQAHRYALALDHESIDRLQSVAAHQLLWWSGATPRRSTLSRAPCWRLAVATPRRRERSGVGYRGHARCRL
ncbi:MAG TPA: hypothetical protein VFX88_00405, partial [Actinomycetota bacterium]|nr:hypothetical protein [Actinomycetota bacterium]